MAERSRPTIDAAARPLPATSPMTRPTREASMGITSYQSPPTSASLAAGM